MSDAAKEREAIVAWLRAQATCGCGGKHGHCNSDSQPLAYADAIERGEHIEYSGYAEVVGDER